LPQQLADVAHHAATPQSRTHALYPEQVTRRGQGIQLARCAEWAGLSGYAPLLGEGDAAFNPSARRRHLEATWFGARKVMVASGETRGLSLSRLRPELTKPKLP